ncbi:MAG: tetratricopeptide repeat protein [Elusimicrobia bacterium]|nr:tetratricopeptide repeat protein [Elusimicrobiota bacterium]
MQSLISSGKAFYEHRFWGVILMAGFLFWGGTAAWSKEDKTSDEESRAWKMLQTEALNNRAPDNNLELLNKFIRSYPQGEHAADARFGIAEVFFHEGQYKQALPQYQLLVDQKDPVYHDDAFLRIGEIRYNTGDIVEARKAWEKLVDRTFGRSVLIAEGLYGLTLCELHDKNYLAATQNVDRLIRKFPSYQNLAKVREIVGILRFQEKNFKEAVEALEGINTPSAAFYRGLSYFHQKQYLEAAEAFGKLPVMTTGTYAELGAYFKAECFRMAQNDTLAASAYEVFMRQYPQSRLKVYSLVHRARSLYRLGNLTEASNCLDNVKQMQSSKEIQGYALYLEAEISAKRNDYARAVALLDRAIRGVSSSDQPDLYASIFVAKGYYMLKMGNSKEAADVMRDLVHELPYHPLGMAAFMLLGNEAYARNDWKAAVSSYETALFKYKYTPLSDVAMAMMLATYFQSEKFQELVTNANRVMKVVISQFPAQDFMWRSYSYLLMAEAYYRLKLYADASRYYEQAMKHPNLSSQARLYLAWSKYHEEKFPEAIHWAQQVLNQVGFHEDYKGSAHFLMAGSYFNQKNFDAAAEGFQSFRKRYPKDSHVPESWLQEGWAHQQAHFFADALKTWGKLVALFPQNPLAQEAQLQIGRLYFQARQYKAAVKAFSNFMSLWPQAPLASEAQWNLAQSYYNAKQYPSAIQAYESFLEKFPQDSRLPDGKNQLMLSYYHQAMRSKDTKLLTKFVEVYPKSDLAPDAQYELAQLYFQGKRWPEAVREFRKLLLEYPGTTQAPLALLAIAHSQEHLKKLEAAITEYESLLQLFPTNPVALDGAMRLGAIYFGMNKFKEAAKAFQFVVDREAPQEIKINAMYNLGISYKRARSFKEAAETFDLFAKTFEDDPKQIDALLEEANIYRTLEDPANALVAYQKILKSKKAEPPMKMEIHNQMGEIYKKMGDAKKAAEAYSQLIPLTPPQQDARLLGLAQLAALYEEQQAWEKAMGVYNHIRRSQGRQDWVRSALKRMKEIQDFLRVQKKKTVDGQKTAPPDTEARGG